MVQSYSIKLSDLSVVCFMQQRRMKQAFDRSGDADHDLLPTAMHSRSAHGCV